MTSQTAPATRKAPWLHQFLVYVFTGLFTLLAYWLLGFMVDDIGKWPAPDYAEFEKQMLDQSLVAKATALQGQTDESNRQIADQQERQKILRDSTSNSQNTMNQLLDIQKLALQKNVTPSPAEQKALAESEELFLNNQKQYQVLNDQIATLNEQLRKTDEQRRALEKTLDERREPIRNEYAAQVREHELKVAGATLAALAPFLAIAFVLFLKQRSGAYAPLVYGFGGAVLLKIAEVMHEHFPSMYFKYILILTCLAVVVRILVYLLRMIAFPKRDWLLKRYREAYEAFFCPICDYPIRRGPLKYMFWSRRSIRKLHLPPQPASDVEQPYTCPNCATLLFEECSVCHAVRHSLLPACEKCGSEKA